MAATGPAVVTLPLLLAGSKYWDQPQLHEKAALVGIAIGLDSKAGKAVLNLALAPENLTSSVLNPSAKLSFKPASRHGITILKTTHEVRHRVSVASIEDDANAEFVATDGVQIDGCGHVSIELELVEVTLAGMTFNCPAWPPEVAPEFRSS